MSYGDLNPHFPILSWCGKLVSRSIGQAREVELLYLSSQTISERLGLSAVVLRPRVLLWPLAFSLWVGDVNQFGELDSLGASSIQMCVLLHFCMSRLQEACSSHELSLVELCLGCRWEEASFAFGSTLSLFYYHLTERWLIKNDFITISLDFSSLLKEDTEVIFHQLLWCFVFITTGVVSDPQWKGTGNIQQPEKGEGECLGSSELLSLNWWWQQWCLLLPDKDLASLFFGSVPGQGNSVPLLYSTDSKHLFEFGCFSQFLNNC